jgi:hypothetical protein
MVTRVGPLQFDWLGSCPWPSAPIIVLSEIIEVEYAPIPMDPFREPPGARSTPKVERLDQAAGL